MDNCVLVDQRNGLCVWNQQKACPAVLGQHFTERQSKA